MKKQQQQHIAMISSSYAQWFSLTKNTEFIFAIEHQLIRIFKNKISLHVTAPKDDILSGVLKQLVQEKLDKG